MAPPPLSAGTFSDHVVPVTTSSSTSSSTTSGVFVGGASTGATSVAVTTPVPVTATAASTTTSTTGISAEVVCPAGLVYSPAEGDCVEPPPPEEVWIVPGDRSLTVYWRDRVAASPPAEEYRVELYNSAGSKLLGNGGRSEARGWELKTVGGEEVREWSETFGYEVPPGYADVAVRLKNGYLYKVGVYSKYIVHDYIVHDSEYPYIRRWVRSEGVFVEARPCAGCGGPHAPPTTTTLVPEVERVSVEGEGGFVSVSAGWAYTCGLRVNGSVECWEWLADYSWSPDRGRGWGWVEGSSSLIPPEGEFVVVDAGWGYACGLRPSGEVECWGRNPSATLPPPRGVFVSVSVGVEHACALRPGGETECWGYVAKPLSSYVGPLVRIPGGSFTAITSGDDFVCGLRPSGEVECWGGNYDDCPYNTVRKGELVKCWDGGPVEGLEPPGGVFESISSALHHTCGIRSSGGVECWSDDPNSEDPFPSPLGEFSMVSAGKGKYACGLRPSGEVECWYSPPEGMRELWAPEGRFAWVSMGDTVACGLPVIGGAVCWNVWEPERNLVWESEGNFNSISARSQREVEEQYDDEGNVIKSVVVRYDYRCTLGVDGEVGCWSKENEFGEASPPGGVFESVSSSDYYSCGLRPSGEAECWGRDDRKQASPPGGVFVQLTTSEKFACGLRPSGEVECWGWYTDLERVLSKVTPPEERLVSVDAGWGGHQWLGSPGHPGGDRTDWGYSCGLRADGSPLCWGGEIAYFPLRGDTKRDRHPVLFPPDGEFTDIEAGRLRACGLRASGEVACWGFFPYFKKEVIHHQAGLEIRNPDPASGEGFLDIDVGGWHACGLRASGEVECWNWPPLKYKHGYGQKYTLKGPYESISAGYWHTCGIRQTGEIDCWGISGHIERLPAASKTDK